MSIAWCNCGKKVDTDFHEFYREEYFNHGMCQSCFEARMKDEPRVYCHRCRKFVDAIDDGETCSLCKLVDAGHVQQITYKEYPCGCEAGPAVEVPDYCPEHRAHKDI